MRRLFAAALSLSALAPLAAVAAPAPSGPQGDSWASIAKLPDWGGIWEEIFPPPHKNEQPSLSPAYSGTAPAQGALSNQEANCVPPGMPSIMRQPYPMEFLETPGKVTIAIEAFSQMRRIFTDGRQHPADPDPTFNGNSIGHWEGDTLVVDTIGFVPDTPLATYGDAYNFRLVGHSDQMHIVERIRLTDANTMEITTTVEDPKALSKPWTTINTLKRHRDWTLSEYVCEQNNRNVVDEKGHEGIVLDHK